MTKTAPRKMDDPAPDWAAEIVTEVCARAGIPEPEVTWYPVRRWATERYGIAENDPLPTLASGIGDAHHIHVNAGRSLLDTKLVLLHELAHALTEQEGYKENQSHIPEFWDNCWMLYRRYDIPMNYAKKREYSYRSWAKPGYRRSLKLHREYPERYER